MPTTFGNHPIRGGGELPICDVQGNQRAATASNQTVSATQIFDAFGNQVNSTGSTASALQWQGANLYRTYSPDAGLLQAGARYYDPQVGRFITRDTVLSQHPYVYCNGDPVNLSDPSGRDAREVWVGFCGFVGGVAGCAAGGGPASGWSGVIGGGLGAWAGCTVGGWMWDQWEVPVVKWLDDGALNAPPNWQMPAW
jgi:RHS repeat-associated protein